MKNTIFTIILFLAIAIIAWFVFKPDEKKIVQKRLDDLCEAVNKQGEENPVTIAAKNLALGNLLHENVTINVNEFPFNGSHSSSELTSLATQGRAYCKNINVHPQSVDILIQDKEATIQTVFKIKLTTNFKGDYNEIRSFVFKLIKTDKKWLFTSFEDQQILKR